MSFDWSTDLMYTLRAILAAVLGGFIGLERGRDKHDAGVRTYAAVSLGACIYAMIGHTPEARDRISAQVVSGLGFLGAGVILRDQGQVRGLTTAATLWATASVGLAIAYERYLLAVLCTSIMVFLLWANHLPGWQRFMRRPPPPPPSPDANPPKEKGPS